MTVSRRALLAALAPLAGAQVAIEPRKAPKPVEQERPASIRVDSNLVLIPVSVNDALNRPITGLEKENFRLFDDKVEQTISQFAMEDEPVAVGLVFDCSGSMGDKLKRSRQAARAFFQTGNDGDDEYFLVEFDDRPRVIVPLTTNAGRIETELLYSKSHGSTALLDALLLAINEMRKSKMKKKALLVISDGGDNHSRYSPAETQRVLREADVLVYAVGVFGGGSTTEEYAGPSLLAKLAESTGGRLYPADAVELPDIAKKIGIDLRNRYMLGFHPTNSTRDGKYHRVDLRLVPPRGLPKLIAHWRTGYYAQQQ